MGRTLSHRLEWLLLRALLTFGGLLGMKTARSLGAALGGVWYRLDSKRRRIATDNVAKAFPDWDRSRVDELVKDAFAHLGGAAMELMPLSVMAPAKLVETVEVEGVELLEETLASGKGVLLLGAHLGNWEIAGMWVSAKGYGLNAVYRSMSNPLVEREVVNLRERYGTGMIPHRNAVRPILKALRRGLPVGMLMDQKPLAREGVMSEFFKRPVATNQGLSLLAVKSSAPVLFCRDELVGGKHLVRFGPFVEVPEEGTSEERVAEMVRRCDDVIEAEVQRTPEQWMWIHKRWRIPTGMKQ